MNLRLVSKSMKEILEKNRFLIVNIRIGEPGAERMRAEFLLRWQGVLKLSYAKPLQPASPWFQSLTSVLESGRLQNLKILDLVIEGQALILVVEMLAGIIQWNRQLNIAISFHGCGADILAAAAPLAALGSTVTMDIFITSGGDQPFTWLQQLQASSVGVGSISLRFKPPRTHTATPQPPPTHPAPPPQGSQRPRAPAMRSATGHARRDTGTAYAAPSRPRTARSSGWKAWL